MKEIYANIFTAILIAILLSTSGCNSSDFNKQEHINIAVTGSITKSGSYSLEKGTTLRLFIEENWRMKPDPNFLLSSVWLDREFDDGLKKIRFDYKSLLEGKYDSFILHDGDIITIGRRLGL